MLLFEYDCSGVDFFDFLMRLCAKYKQLYIKMIKPILETDEVGNEGLTFGIERGSLIKIKLNRNIEYIGRPINIACRLQASIRDGDQGPQNKAIISSHFYNSLTYKIDNDFHCIRVKRKLKNIIGGSSYNCVKILILDYD